MTENLLDGHLTDSQVELLGHMNMFDLEEFYLSNIVGAAVCIITKNQMIMCETYVKKAPSLYTTHFETANAIYKSIYDKNLKEREYRENDTIIWQQQINNDGNIVMQLCNKDYFNIICIPDDLSDEQIEMLDNFKNRINNIIYNNYEYFKENPITFKVYTGSDKFELTNSIDEVLESIKNKRR